MIAIIPARGGSKGLPGKNIKELCGKPLIAHTIEAALNAKGIDRVIVTTDSEEIAVVAQRYGAEVPFMRPAELAGDTSSAIDVYLHAVSFLEKHSGKEIEQFMVLLPTTPLRNAGHIESALKRFADTKAETLISMKEADVPISWYYAMNEEGRVKNLGINAENAVANRQVNEKHYIPNGAIYILNKKLLHEKRTYYCENTVAYLMDAEDSIDIDHALDFKIAELLLKERTIKCQEIGKEK